MSSFRDLHGRRKEKFSRPFSKRRQENFLMLLLLSLFVCYFIMFNLPEKYSNIPRRKTPQTQKKKISVDFNSTVLLPWMDSLAFIHLNSAFNAADNNATFSMIFSYSTKQDNISQELKENDKRSIWKLSRFLSSMEEFHVATCLEEPFIHVTESDSKSDYRPCEAQKEKTRGKYLAGFVLVSIYHEKVERLHQKYRSGTKYATKEFSTS